MRSGLTHRIFSGIEQLFYPPKCMKCGVYMDTTVQSSATIETCFCDQCLSCGFSLIDKPYCKKCGFKFVQGSSDNHVCQACLKTPLTLGKVRAAALYQGVLKDAIHLFKYQSQLSVAKVFEDLMFQTYEQHFFKDPIDVIMPIPLHKKRLKDRGFNQAFILIRNFKKKYERKWGKQPHWQMDTQSLFRTKKTSPQTGFDIDQRKKNLKGAFAVINEKHIENKHILLIDDVFTTGATCNEAAVQLLKHNALKVDALVLARA